MANSSYRAQVGSIMGVLMILKLSDYISRHIPIICTVLRVTGQASLYVLIIHTLFGGLIQKWVSLRFATTNVLFMLACTMLQVVMAIIVRMLIVYIRSAATKSSC